MLCKAHNLKGNNIHSGKMDHRQWRTNRLFFAEIRENVTIFSY